MKCKVDGCDRLVRTSGYCSRHYHNVWRTGSPFGKTKIVERGAMTRHPLYRIWQGMHQRCTYEGSEGYEDYGARGIAVCERWADFWNFADDMGDRPSMHHTIDRIDVNRGYEPGNVRWATPDVQMRNRTITRLSADQRAEAVRLFNTGMTKAAVARAISGDYAAVLHLLNGETFQDITYPMRDVKRCIHPGCERRPMARGRCRQHGYWAEESKTLADVAELPVERKCEQCETALPVHARIDRRFCGQACKMRWSRRHGCYTKDRLDEKATRCSRDDCDEPSVARGLCKRHYSIGRYHETKQTADPTLTVDGRPKQKTGRKSLSLTCSESGCGVPAVGRGLCQKHYNKAYHARRRLAASISVERGDA